MQSASNSLSDNFYEYAQQIFFECSSPVGSVVMQSQVFAGRALPDTSSRQLPFQQQRQTADRARWRLNVQAAGSTYGTNFRVTTFGESHGKAVGCVIDGVPPRLPITQEEIQV